ncbi:gliding motility-associated C-terminal domain-containing protein [Mariniflexile sp. AS56]|uniref:T9SS type B sorting domain-containing protein n=1 Tax=Mariniflexile sp. AS56 TaxID=3063957 RepID=UPI0026EA8BE9|nr:gliding motility-associated C-terminal domain-containing protein [Mariniflexile sp. AS56]MDO7171135.1 gliding motility-associated C-terminal domain-containing protein [Mariniflexile sp. AS56]
MRNLTFINLVFFVAFFTQIISAQVVIGKPSLGFSQACANPSFNSYNTTFTFSPEASLTGSNQFIIELSDASGSFTTPTVVFTSAQGAVTVSPATLSFSLPTTTGGEAYKIRIKTTSPAGSSTPSNAFPAYYKLQDTPFSINNLIATGAYCAGGSYLLTIDNPGTGDNDSPLKYPSLSFNWYKETGSTPVLVAAGETLAVNAPGTYFARTNYGTCTSESYSNRVTVSEATSSSTSSISSSLGNPYCSSEGATTLSAIKGNSYKWYKDGNEIDGATNQMYVTNEAGMYAVTVDLGSCTTGATIDLENSGFTSSIDVSEFNTIETGDSLTATVTTDAANPTFEWYFNETLIPNETSNSYEASQIGNYKVVITQTEGCAASTEYRFSITEPFPSVPNIPNLISPNGDGINDTWVIPQEYVVGTNTEVLILSSQGKVMLQTNEYQNNWPENQLDFKSVNPVYYYIITPTNNNIRKGSITVVK